MQNYKSAKNNERRSQKTEESIKKEDIFKMAKKEKKKDKSKIKSAPSYAGRTKKTVSRISYFIKLKSCYLMGFICAIIR